MNSAKMYNIPFWSMCVFLIFGALVYSAGVFDVRWFFCAIISLMAVLFFVKQSNTIVFIGVSNILFFFLGGLRVQLSIPENQPNHIIHKRTTVQPIETVFVITDRFKDSKKWINYKASVSQVNNTKASGNILLKVKKSDSVLLQKGNSYVGLLNLNKLKKDAYPYSFSYNNYLLNLGITHQVLGSSKSLVLLPNKTNQLLRFIGKLQLQLNESLKCQNLDAKVIQLTQALVLGNKKELDKKLSEDFAKAGVIHVLAISGLHIGIIYMVFVWLFKLVLYKHEYRIVRSVLVLLLLWLFVWFSGASASALRATTMFSCFEISRLLLRRQHPLNALFLCIFVLFLMDPQILFSVGFQLSVTAVASIIIGMPKLQKLWQPRTLIVKYIWGIVCVSLCAQIGLLPLSIYYFHQIPMLFLVANIPVMICIPVIMGFAILMVLGSYFYTLPEYIVQGYNFMILKLIHFVNWVASFEIFVLKDLYISGFTVMEYYLIFAYLRWWYNDFQKGLKYLSLPLACMLIIGFVEFHKNRFIKEVWLLNDYKNTVVVEVASNQVNVFSSKALTELDKNYKIIPVLGELHLSKANYHQLQQGYSIENNVVLIVGQNFIPKIKSRIETIIICNSPKINLERLVEELKPKHLLSTANNKRDLVKKWKQTCENSGVNFYDVSEQGSLRLDKL